MERTWSSSASASDRGGHFILEFGKMVATIQAYAGVLLLLVQLLPSPGLGGRQVNSKVHPKSQKCPQAAKNEKYT